MKSLTITTDQTNGEVDLLFASTTSEPELLDELHDDVLPSIDGASQKGPVRDFIVAVREEDFQEVVERLAATYRSRGFDVSFD